MRKDAGFEVMDRIKVYVEGNDKLGDVMKKNEAQISGVVLSDEIVLGQALGFAKEWDINGESVKLGVEKQ